MSDIKLSWRQVSADISVNSSDIDRDDGLQTSVIISLFTDRRAQDADPLPPGETQRRGWWGDVANDDRNDRIGSKLWLLAREKQIQQVLNRAKEYVQECLQWLIDDRVALKIEVQVENVARGIIGIAVQIYRPEKPNVSYRFEYVWDAQFSILRGQNGV